MNDRSRCPRQRDAIAPVAGLLVALLVAALAAAPAAAQLFSLYPERSPRDLQAALDGLGGPPARLAFSQWRPYGLPVRVDGLALELAPAGLRLGASLARQDWGPVAAWQLGLRALRPLGEGLALGLAWSGERLDAGPAAASLELLGAVGRRPVLVVSTRLAGSPGAGLAPRGAASQFGLSLAEGGWQVRLWRRPGGPCGAEEGLAVERRVGPCELGLLANWPDWQGFTLRYEGRRWGLALEERFHAELGASHGLRLLLR